MTAMPSSIVNGCVKVITGDYCIAGLDHSVSGPDPFPLGHTYFSSSQVEECILNGGSKKDKHNFHGVTERHTTTYKSQHARAHFGEPIDKPHYPSTERDLQK
jgi:hypothetical protein